MKHLILLTLLVMALVSCGSPAASISQYEDASVGILIAPPPNTEDVYLSVLNFTTPDSRCVTLELSEPVTSCLFEGVSLNGVTTPSIMVQGFKKNSDLPTSCTITFYFGLGAVPKFEFCQVGEDALP